ncbi:uncharacterized protein [Nicotiana tomentosiformis]|uniref:uncharacterized protein n=1 Tax=Nicotiana tomentosiformis TaxID=4098 RepID=UPI00388C352C
MKIALLWKRKLGFVTGTCTNESCETELHEQWETCNAIVLLWLMNTMLTELLSGIAYASNAHLVWEDRRERFDKVNRMRIFQIHRAIATLSQGTYYVSAYFTKLKARRQILLKSNEPSLNQTYAMVIEDESEHSSSGLSSLGKKKGDPMAMQFGNQQSINAVNNICGNAGSADVQSQSYSAAADLQTTLDGKGPYFIEEQYKQILGLLSKDNSDAQANMAGIATCLMTISFANEWIVDSGATYHIAATENLLKDVAHTRKDLYSGRVKGISKENAGLYILREAIDRNKIKTFCSLIS